MKFPFFAFLFLLLFNKSLSAQVLYVTANGADANDGKTIQTAFRTLQKAAAVFQAGETVLIGDG